jgi:phage terminase small subunit
MKKKSVVKRVKAKKAESGTKVSRETKLNDRQKLFCLEYLKDLNGAAAARRAGYSAHTAHEQAAQLLAKLSIQSELQGLLESKLGKEDDEVTRWLQEVKKLAYFDGKQVFYNVNEHGVTLKDWKKIDGALIQGASEKRDKDGNVIVELKIPDKTKNLELLGKYLKILTDKHEHSGTVKMGFAETLQKKWDESGS